VGDIPRFLLFFSYDLGIVFRVLLLYVESFPVFSRSLHFLGCIWRLWSILGQNRQLKSH